MLVFVDYYYGDRVVHKLDDSVEYMVVSYQISVGREITYGCSDKGGGWRWFRGYEIKKANNKREIKQLGLEIRTHKRVAK